MGVERGLGLVPSDTARSGLVERACLSKDLGALLGSGRECCRQRNRECKGPGEGGCFGGPTPGLLERGNLLICADVSSTEDTLGTWLLVTLLQEYLFPRS